MPRVPLIALALFASIARAAEAPPPAADTTGWPGPKSPAESLACIKVPAGYKVELVAAEPLVQDPIAFAWAPDGRMYVVEMGDYPLGVDGKGGGRGQPGGRVKLLTDTDGDGVYDKATTFLDNLGFPTSVIPWRDGVLVAAAPDILFARDTKGTGVADDIKVVFTGFNEGNQQHRLNSFTYGLDGWIYTANGDSGGMIKCVNALHPLLPGDKPAQAEPVSISGRDFRFKPDTGEFETVSGVSQFGRCRDDYGNWFGCNNSNPLFHFPLDEKMLRRNPYAAVSPGVLRVDVSDKPGAAPVYPISKTLARFNDYHTADHFTSACSAHVYRDEYLFPRGQATYKDDELIGEWSVHVGGPKVPIKTILPSKRLIATGDTIILMFKEDHGPEDGSTSREIVKADGTFSIPRLRSFPAAGIDGAALLQAIFAAYDKSAIDLVPLTIQIRLIAQGAADLDSRQVFISEPVHNLVHRQVMAPAGATFTSRRAYAGQASEFLASSDNWFRPTTVATGPDGALYVADMYRLVIEHPQWIPKDWQAKLDLRSGSDMGRIYRVVRTDRKTIPIPHLDKMRPNQLVDALTSPNGPVRDLVQQMLLWRGNKDVAPALEQLAHSSKSDVARIHALYLLDAMGALKAPLTEETIFNPENRQALRHAIRLSRSPAKLADITHGDPLIDIDLAYALGGASDAGSAARIAGLVPPSRPEFSEPDRFLVAAAISSLNEKNVAAVAAEVVKSAKTQQPSSAFLAGIIKTALGCKQPAAIASALTVLTTPAQTPPAIPPAIKPPVQPDAAFDPWQFRAIAGLLDSLDDAQTPLAKLADADGSIKTAVAQVERMTAAARALVADEKTPLESRIAAMGLLAREVGNLHKDMLAMDALISPASPPELQLAAITTLGRRRGPIGPVRLLAHWPSLTPDLRNAVVDALSSRQDSAGALLDAVEQGKIRPTEIEASRRQKLMQAGPGGIRKRASAVLAATLNPDRQKVIDSLKPALTLPANFAAGKDVFTRTCATCHRLGEIGHAVGPDLASVGDKSPEGLLIAIIDPNRVVEARYVNYIADTRDDQTHTGLLTGETATSITLLGPDGKSETVLRADLKDLRSSNSSLMPDGLETSLKPQELADLIAFVRMAK